MTKHKIKEPLHILRVEAIFFLLASCTLLMSLVSSGQTRQTIAILHYFSGFRNSKVSWWALYEKNNLKILGYQSIKIDYVGFTQN